MNFLSIEQLSGERLRHLLERALFWKQQRGASSDLLSGQTWGLMFTKSSTRTRVSFEVGVREMGGSVMFLSGRDLQLGRGEPIRDTARVMGRMIHGAIIRNDSQADLEEFAQYAGIPTINALTEMEHPCQVLADLLTLREFLGKDWEKEAVCFLGDGDCNMARSWIWAAAHLGLDLTIAAPPAFQPSKELIGQSGNTVNVIGDPREAVRDARVLYTDVWVSMGREEESESRLQTLKPYQINEELLGLTGASPLVLHCLPAYREKEITESVLEAQADVIFQQAENRIHAQKAILEFCVEHS
ncbi:MAG: ornithine carbamoyltransferase [Verrucomicrobiota bacterium]